ncbi:MerR family transcriptional regulator [Roseospira goensis]|uniref:DNA-binding transcriptional MerR regulator n=1 Tax=Roseospira goensis TaxID=391922 RepID=A0A7W6WMV1_9PROT|nr:MerR family transcriptional regulator [Roseospira goensis]MBB4287867.1 DNA-binding transcriptional MerR regulator [Roseospira goensis]
MTANLSYSAIVVSAVTGIPRNTLNSWIHRGYIPGASETVAGRARTFSFADIVSLACIAELVNHDVPIRVAAEVFSRQDLRSWIDVHQEYEEAGVPEEPLYVSIIKARDTEGRDYVDFALMYDTAELQAEVAVRRLAVILDVSAIRRETAEKLRGA